MNRYIIIITLILLSTDAYSYDGQPIDQVNEFFKEMAVDSNKAIDNLYASNPAMEQKAQALTMMKGQISQISALYGSLLGYEIIATEELSPSLIRISALEKHSLHPMTWEFYFYKPENMWMISQATFFDQFQNIGPKK